MKILIIGGTGFIGSHLVDILKNSHDVTVFSRSPNKFKEESPKVNYIYKDFEDLAALDKALKNQDVVFHLLSTTVPVTGNADPGYDIRSNLIGAINFLDLLKASKIRRLIYASSGGTVYGNPEYLPIDEKHPCNPIGSYGIVKLAIENYIRMFAQQNNFSYLIVRPSNPYGPRQNYLGSQGLIAKLIYCGLVSKEFQIWGDGSAIRDYIYIDDLVDFLKIAGLSDKSGIFNVGSGVGQSINEIIEKLRGVTSNLPSISYADKNGTFVEKVVLDNSSSIDTFNWRPKVSMTNGLLLHNEWMKQLQLK